MRTTIERIAFKVIVSIITLVLIGFNIETIKEALTVETTPPVYLMKAYTVILSVLIISGLIYSLVKNILDIEESYSLYKKQQDLIRYKKSLYKDFPKQMTRTKEEDSRTRPITSEEAYHNDIENKVFNTLRPDSNIIRKDLIEDTVNKTIEECMPQNPIDLKFDKLEEKANEAVINLKKRRNVQE